MNVYCNINCCPYEGMCGNGLRESNKVYLARNLRTSALAVAAAEDIEPGEVIGQYIGKLEHVSMNRSVRPRNTGFRLVMRQRPERPEYAVRVSIKRRAHGGPYAICESLLRASRRVRRGRERAANHGGRGYDRAHSSWARS